MKTKFAKPGVEEQFPQPHPNIYWTTFREVGRLIRQQKGTKCITECDVQKAYIVVMVKSYVYNIVHIQYGQA